MIINQGCSILPLDNNFITQNFTTKDKIVSEDDIKSVLQSNLNNLAHILVRLPRREIDILIMYYILGKSQEDIAEIFHITQSGISTRIKKILDRLTFVLTIPRISVKNLIKDLKNVYKDVLDLNIMVLMYLSTSHSEVARRLNISQSKVRWRYYSNLEKLKEYSITTKNPKIAEYVKIYKKIVDNYTILSDISLNKVGSFNGVCFLD